MGRPQRSRPRIGVALGSGSARGWAHIGVLRALSEMGVRSDVVCGTSIGALVGAAYGRGELDALEAWARAFTKLDILRLLDVTAARGGFIAGVRLLEGFRELTPDAAIEDLAVAYGAVATDFETGREVWLTRGSLLEAVRASISLPGIFVPYRHEGRWLVDGGLVNPVPVSVCRALGAEVVIAVNLSGDLAMRNALLRGAAEGHEESRRFEDALARLPPKLRERLEGPAALLDAALAGRGRERAPGLFDVLAGAMNIVQDRITRSRMAGDPPDVLVAPRLAHVRMLDFDQADELIAEGRAAFAQARPTLERLLEG